MTRRWISVGLALTVGCASWSTNQLFAKAKTEKEPSRTAKSQSAGAERLVTEKLGGTDRYLTFVSTDKPMYRGGEKVYVRGVILNAANHKPVPDGTQTTASIQIKGPKGDVIATGNALAEDSVWGYSWDVPAEQSGGEYTASVTYPWDGLTPAERKFDVRSYRAPRLKSQITFLRDGYGPGDKVTATLDVKRAEGGIPEGAKITVIARVDGTEIKGTSTNLDDKGLSTVTFDLPHDIPRGEGTLSLAIEDGGVVETASKSIPILLQTVDLQMYPEGGDLIAGFKNRVYLQANQPNGKPADLSGKLMWKKDSQTGIVTNFRTEHEGRGRFEFTPETDKEYFLSISEPAGIKTTYPLPDTKIKGAVISSSQNVFRKGRPVEVQVGCTDKKYHVTLSKREVEVATGADVTNQPSGKHGRELQKVSFNVPPNVDGVLAVTVWDENDIPLAERLIFREPSKAINVSITPDKPTFVPGESAKLTVKTTDSDGQPVSSVVGLTVTDDTVLELVEKREKAPHLPVMVFLEPEVQDLADASVYLDAANPKAPMMTDLLLGTQGWRRFAFVDVDKFIAAKGDAAKRVVALNLTPVQGFGRNSRLINGRIGEKGAAMNMGAGAGLGLRAPNMGAAMGGMANRIDRQPQRVRGVQLNRNQTEFGQGFGLRGQHPNLQLPEDIGRVEGPRDINLFQVEPTVIDERRYTSGRSERHQEPGPLNGFGLPFGVPNPGHNGKVAHGYQINGNTGLAQLSSVDKYTFFPSSRPQAVVVREYAHKVREGRQSSDRIDFDETLYWNAGVKTDAKTGEATVEFGLNDSVTTFRVFADAFTGSGAVGTVNKGIESVQPFYADAKMPLEVTSGDKILLPISLVNGTKGAFPDVKLKVELDGDSRLSTLQKGTADLGAGGRVRWIQPIDVGVGNDTKNLTVTANAGTFEDKVVRKLSIKPQGFPTELAFGGVLEPDKPEVHIITIAKNIAPGSVSSHTAVFPTPLANLTEALQRMILDPNGCFEQTSSTSYPLTMAQQYFLSHTSVDPKLVATSREKLDAGYKKLVSFWCPDRGYEWFGENPGHEALTAFGLLHFTDMEKVRDVDQKMVATTREWLLKQKDGQGGFTRKRRALHSWIEDKDCSNAYILWALLECGQPAADLKPELASLKTAADASKNNYVVALAANAMFLAGNTNEAKKLMDRLASKQKSDGSVNEVTSSIVGSGGESLEVEGTSLATIAWLRDPAYAPNVEKSIHYLADSCKAGRYGSTQATVLALRSIVAYDKLHAHPKKAGKIREYVDGHPIGDYVSFDPSTQGALKLPDLGEVLTPGEHKVELRLEGGSAMPYSMAATYNALTPVSANDCKIDIAVKMAQDKVTEGNATEANVTVTNKTSEVIPSPVAIVGLPGGLEVRHDQLKELKKKGVIDNYEVRGREVVLYWRTLDKNAKIEVPLSLIAAIPGTYTGPASRAYLYYTDENKQWVDGLKIEIAAK
jgi:alpha-2-macroglobulin-like protein